jgi:hypothetical protein
VVCSSLTCCASRRHRSMRSRIWSSGSLLILRHSRKDVSGS